MTAGRVHADDLHAEVRRRLGLPGAKGRARERPSRAGQGDAQACPGRCVGRHGCGQSFPHYRAWEKHFDAGCRGRWAVDL